MTKQLYLEAIEALRLRVEAAGEDEALAVLDMLAEEVVKALARFNVAERAESATDTATPGSQAEPPPDAWNWDGVTAVGGDDWTDDEEEDDDLFTGGDWDPEEDSDLFEDDPDFAREYIGDDDESGL